MIGRIAAWAIVALICATVWQYGSKWRSPWAIATTSPVIANLPPPAPGCSEHCK